MYKQFFSNSDLLLWPVIGFGIFFTVFLAVLFRVLVWRRSRDQWHDLAIMPLDSNETAVHSDEKERI